VPRDALVTTLRTAFGGMIGAVFALFVAASVYFSLYAALTLICIGVAAGAYLGFRYGDPFLVWILKLWNRPGD
jgi:hypothetical protein